VEVIFRRQIRDSDDPKRTREELVADYEQRFSNPYQAAARGFVDQVIDPIETRPELIKAFTALLSKRESRPARKHGNLPV